MVNTFPLPIHVRKKRLRLRDRERERERRVASRIPGDYRIEKDHCNL